MRSDFCQSVVVRVSDVTVHVTKGIVNFVLHLVSTCRCPPSILLYVKHIVCAVNVRFAKAGVAFR